MVRAPVPTPSTAPAAARFFRARARNLVRHRLPATLAGVVVGGAVLAALLFLTRTERAALLQLPAPPDTLPLATVASRTRLALLAADRLLAETPPPGRPARRALAVSTVVTDPVTGRVDTIAPIDAPTATPTPGAVSGRDTVAAQLASLGAGLVRAQNAPLASSWRALAADPALASEPRARLLADSLAAAERARDEYDAVGGVDPIYLELSSRVATIGRAIERLADARRAALLAASSVVVTDAGTAPSVEVLAAERARDSVRYARARRTRDSVARRLAAVARALEDQRTRAVARDSLATLAERRVGALAPPIAMLGASVVVGIGVALLVALGLELRRPRLADASEVAAIGALPVLLVLEPEDVADDEALASAFAQFAFEVGTGLLATRALVLVGDDATLALRTAARVAERAAYDGRRVHLAAPRAGQAVMTARTRRATPTGVPALRVEPARLASVEWADVEPVGAVAPDILRIRAGTLLELQRALASEVPDAVVVLVARAGATSARWLDTARRDVTLAHGRPPAGVILWNAAADFEDPLAEQVTAALARADERRLAPRGG